VVELEIGTAHGLPVTVALAPFLSVSAAMWEIGGLHRGLPRPVVRAAAAGLSGRGWRALRTVGDPSGSMSPDCLHPPMRSGTDGDVASSLELLRAVDGDELVEELRCEFPAHLPQVWRGPMEQPRVWLTAYADAAEAVHHRLEPLLARAGKLIDREVERVGSAVVRGQVDVLLATLNPRIRFARGVLTYDHPVAGRHALGGRRLVLMPMVAGPRLLVTNVDQPDWVCLAYPVTGLGAVTESRGEPRADPLRELLGPNQAELLLMLATTRTMGELAIALQVGPSTITGYCRRLEGVDLLRRERRGREVRVSRTPRGDELIEVMRP
jgi:DNA-binding CsgD family transcriptional regulator